MKILWPEPGKYIVAVSGGIDSVSLLHLLAQNKTRVSEYELIVAHVDHGWRTDSAADSRFVKALAEKYNLQFVGTKLNLKKKNEAEARKERWRFLEAMRKQHNSLAVLTAHHLDDVVETMVFNVRRGTGRSGLTSLKESVTVKRPLLYATKAEVKNYAILHRLEFNEDSTNFDLKYSRNNIRAQLHEKNELKSELQKIYNSMLKINKEIDTLLGGVAKKIAKASVRNHEIDRELFKKLDIKVQLELLRYLVLQLNPNAELNAEQITRGVAGITNALPGKITELGSKMEVLHSRKISNLVFISTPRMEVLK